MFLRRIMWNSRWIQPPKILYGDVFLWNRKVRIEQGAKWGFG
jgi:hypothetical protein